MSSIPIDRSGDLVRLRAAGFNIQVTSSALLLVRDVPYVNAQRQVVRGTIVSNLDLAGDVTSRPQDHTVKFIGDHPCDSNGVDLDDLRHSSGVFNIADGVMAQHSFSRKPGREYYLDYFEKITTYVELIEQHAVRLDPNATARTGRVVEPENDDSPFNYLDTASARAEINPITAKLAGERIAIVGVGGTGSYVLDLVAKTPAREIHLFDEDRFLTHNAFRAPGAPAIDKLRGQPSKVEYFGDIYSLMHRGIVTHPISLDAHNARQLQGMSFVFLCMDGGAAKEAIVKVLEELNISFVDVGMGLYAKRERIGGTLRSVLSTPSNRETARQNISFVRDDADNEYDKNIQVADLNALNACLAVMSWKKLRGFYADLGRERLSTFTVPTSSLVKGDRE